MKGKLDGVTSIAYFMCVLFFFVALFIPLFITPRQMSTPSRWWILIWMLFAIIIFEKRIWMERQPRSPSHSFHGMQTAISQSASQSFIQNASITLRINAAIAWNANKPFEIQWILRNKQRKRSAVHQIYINWFGYWWCGVAGPFVFAVSIFGILYFKTSCRMNSNFQWNRN